ncbi:hypothetical protein, partial [Nguyenibacter vanlangensis]|uniref:hypothetical protein n=1 Tax=Nguyenibacter vanlangensis TaxID=1216886 RepID=UPI001C400CF9
AGLTPARTPPLELESLNTAPSYQRRMNTPASLAGCLLRYDASGSSFDILEGFLANVSGLVNLIQFRMGNCGW